MGGPDRRRQRFYLARQDPTCWYCGVLVREYITENGGDQEPDQATLEHLVSRRNPMRLVPGDGTVRRVLACYDCNNSRGAWTAALMGEDQRLRAEAEIAWRPTIGQLVAMT
jgi:5-methylcytosine-specific restriction endonuclease McrA